VEVVCPGIDLLAVTATTEDREVMGIDGETELLLGEVSQVHEQFVGCLDRLSAVFAHEMAMGGRGQVVRGGSMSEM